MTIARDLAARIGKAIENDTLTSSGKGSMITAYSTINDIPSVGNDSGDMAFILSGDQANRAYIWNGFGWRSFGLGSILSD